MFFFKNKIDITVLITSIYERNITIETAKYYSEICSEVILVDEEQPHLPSADVSKLKKKGITYIGYKTDNNALSIKSVYQKRLIAAKKSNKRYVVHSNHDERYTYHGLLACISELEKNKNLIICAGQAVAARKNEQKIYYTRSYKKLCDYQNTRTVEERLYNHAKLYTPLAHYSVWRKEFYINTSEKTMSVHDLIPSSGIMDEVIFEFTADLAGNSKTVPDLYWIRNRINLPGPKHERDKGNYAFKIMENKLRILLKDLDNVQLDVVINNLLNSSPSFQSKTFLEKSIISIKLMIRNIIKKKNKMRRIELVDDIYTLLNDNKIKYEKNDLNNLLNSMRL